MANDNGQERGVTGPERDPVVGKSLSGPVLVTCALLFASLMWALVDELVLERPWKSYQQRFRKVYTSYLEKLGPRQASAEKAVLASPEYRKLDAALQAAEREAAPRLRAIQQELDGIRSNLAAIKDPFQDARARIAALTYELDHTESGRGKESLRKDIEEVRKTTYRVNLPTKQSSAMAFLELEKRFADLKTRETQLNAEQARITAAARELRRQRAEYLTDHLTGLNQQQIDGLLRKMDGYRVEIRQIEVAEAGLVDRCESCHTAIREPVRLTAAEMGGERVFVSHPNKALLEIHDPERFGCTPCHNGNGRATASVEKAHGNYDHWLWPLFAAENAQAGCVQCHYADRVLEYAPVLTRGRDLYQLKGCVGCHRHESFDREADALTGVRKEIQSIESRQKEMRLDADREVKEGDSADTNEAAQKHYAQAEILRVNASNLDAKVAELERKSHFLMQDVKKIGPNLKDARLKLRKEWIPVWLKDPHAFRPGSKMPKFRLRDDEVRALAAFVWQSGWDGPPVEKNSPGNAANGKELFETRGCMGCHSMGEGNRREGGEFAANLSRLGEKANPDYIVRWIHDPRQRTRPYCPREARDLGPEDYARRGLPYRFDLEHSTCPNDGAELQVQNMTVMPTLRLTWNDARDVAAYLTSLRHGNASYPANVAYMDDTALAGRGRQLAGRYGCASCHEIRGLEDAPRIGTELTKEASKPMEQLDFGLLEHEARKAGWYNHKGFFERKLASPAVFDKGREKAPEEQLRMPDFELSKEDRRALTTFLLGSLDSPTGGEFRYIPARLRHNATDEQRDIQVGWWLIKKYNCMGCHNIQPGQKSTLSGMARYQDPDWKEQLPPQLLQEGARVNPEWLMRFLENPALSEKETDRNGVRTYLKARMPTFHFSPNEIRVLVRFFGALAAQQAPYIAQRLEPLDERERQMARALFSSKAAPCLKCHLTGEPNHDRFATAPNFLTARERLKPNWTARWMLEPAAIAPGTAMPSGLFRKEGERWVFAGPVPESFKGYTKDHVELLVRYMFQFTPEEQIRLRQTLPATAGSAKGGV